MRSTLNFFDIFEKRSRTARKSFTSAALSTHTHTLIRISPSSSVLQQLIDRGTCVAVHVLKDLHDLVDVVETELRDLGHSLLELRGHHRLLFNHRRSNGRRWWRANE